MGLNIKNPRVLELTRELATVLGTTQVSALELALAEKLERERIGDRSRRTQVRDDLREIRRMALGGPAREQIDDEMYDEWGLPR